MPFILESIVATKNQDGTFHIRPYGLHRDGAHWIFLPFRPSAAIENVERHPFLTVSSPSDVRVIAGILTGRLTPDTLPADRIDGVRLKECFAHMELEVIGVEDHDQRPRFTCKVVTQASHMPFLGYNRAQAAVIEGAILSTRLGMLTREKIDSEMAYLQIAIDKCAGDEEREAWEWVNERVWGVCKF